ncbi:MAG: bifunctional riboflavin kinase/FAD synthetase [Gemmatimonadota bacterium]|nr:bifunctional riboflavin kinase/FAD synthetase [Gemmatimonadota bacterium]HEU4988614.1 bifunctional riboflavin kinase/FAD synthetase [Gemmatimonadaceae bacterium]
MPDGSPLPPTVTGTAVTVGTFDGVHRGHQYVLERLRARGAALGVPTLVVTFEPHPLEIVRPQAAPPRLTVREEKLLALAACGVDFVAEIPFTPAFRALSAEAFIRDVLVRRYRVRALLIGHDHGFGRGREGDAELVQGIARTAGFEADVVDAVPLANGGTLSSTVIREAIAAGDLATAARGLGRFYEAVGRVTAGEGRGRLLGFPTINLALPSPRKLLPPVGVYAVRVTSATGTFGGMMNLGPRPTFGDEAITLEVHLFDAAGDWYGRPVGVQFVARLRDTMKFSGPDALVSQLKLDAENARRALTEVRAPDTLIGSG